MSIPVYEKTILGYDFEWEEEKIDIRVGKLKFKDGTLKGEVIVKTSLPGYHEHLHQAVFNFSSTRAKEELVRTLKKLCEEVDWDVIIEQLRVYVLRLYQQGEPVIELTYQQEVQPPAYIVYPLILKNQISLVFGNGGVGKSTLALLLSVYAQGAKGNLGIQAQQSVQSVLYLDYETDKDAILWQFKNILAGMESNGYTLQYRKCSIPLAEDIENIKQVVWQTNAGLVIVDSVGAACGSDLNEAHTANSLTLALRSLNTTCLLISHTSKEKQNKKTPYGSVYFYNNARNIWEVKKMQEAGKDEILIGLFHRKANLSKLHKPIGLKFIYLEDKIEVRRQDINEVEEFAKEISLKERIISLLKEKGLLTATEIAEHLGVDPHEVRSRLSELKRKGIVTKISDRWGIAYENEPF